ncbi:DUF58 domain-containing protein [Nocardioides sp. GY 10113]|uniref:DUF58 domain-containing protein n=1 Tax=Nocardioides sp. GY 10113 TaxID=2569761 RepID=UPI0010A850F3|nr:DUF58 domain-containing protein [Nocardioides sp. GY 10113]TIC88650.1 DUF58 domain-containing protein [Nocardioides sp. GY 10113]
MATTREALSGLTLRGRAFLAAGATAIVCSVLLGQPALTRIGVLVLALPLLAAVAVGRRRYAVTVHRELAPRLVTAGQTANVTLTLSNAGQRSAGALLVEDRLPYALGHSAHFALQGLRRRWERTVDYQVRADTRGQYEIGPLTTRAIDPFGLVEVRRTHPATLALTVTPRTISLPTIGLTGGWSGSGEHRPQAFAAGSAEDVSVREYRRGDELRRVHWRSSARLGDLMVRKEEQPWEARATVFLDNRRLAHHGKGATSTFEAAVTVAASVAVHLDLHGYTVRLISAQGIGTGPGEPLAAVLEHLALIQLTSQPRIDLSWCGEQTHGGLVVGVLGRLTAADIPALRRLRHDAATAMSIELDLARWAEAAGTTAVTASGQDAVTAASLGWRSVSIGPHDRLEGAWRDLGRRRDRGAGA